MGLHFSKEEIASRKSKVISSMKEQNINALLMFKQESMYWLTGYDSFGFVFFQSLILNEDGEVILLTRAPDLRQAENTSNIKNIIIWEDKENSSPSHLLKSILIDLKLKGKNIGIEYDTYGLTGRNTLKLNNTLKDFGNLEDVAKEINGMEIPNTESVMDAFIDNQNRDEDDRERYHKLYGFDYRDASGYDIIINTNDKEVEDVAKEINESIEKHDSVWIERRP